MKVLLQRYTGPSLFISTCSTEAVTVLLVVGGVVVVVVTGLAGWRVVAETVAGGTGAVGPSGRATTTFGWIGVGYGVAIWIREDRKRDGGRGSVAMQNQTLTEKEGSRKSNDP